MAKRSRVQTIDQPLPNSVQNGLNSTIGTTNETHTIGMSLAMTGANLERIGRGAQKQIANEAP
jgi:hypothetical protein